MKTRPANKISHKHLDQALADLMQLFKLAKDDHTEIAIQISASIGDGMSRLVYCKDAKSAMILEHIVTRDLAELREKNKEIYS